MAIVTRIPNKNKFLIPSVQVPFLLNNPLFDGTYQNNGNKINFFKTEKNAIYLIERLTVVANIPESEYLNAINSNNIPRITFSKKKNGSILFVNDFQVAAYMREKDVSVLISNDQNDDYIQLSMNGLLTQTAELIGINSIVFSIIANVFIMDSNEFNKFVKENPQAVI